LEVTVKRYIDSGTVNEKINRLVKQYPIEDHFLSWLEFCRTVKSTLDIVEEEAMRYARSEDS